VIDNVVVLVLLTLLVMIGFCQTVCAAEIKMNVYYPRRR